MNSVMNAVGLGYSEVKMKPYLKMAVQRIQISNNKMTTSVKHQKKEIATLLAEGKEEKARIKVEHIIRDDFTIEGLEVLELLCELVHERIKQISNSNQKLGCPSELNEAISSLIWAANNCSITELKVVKDQLIYKYGSEYGQIAAGNVGNVVNKRLYAKLVYQPPSDKLKIRYLEEIAKAYKINWTPLFTPDDEVVASALDESVLTGYSIPMAPGSGLTSAYTNTLLSGSQSNAASLPPPSTMTTTTTTTIPAPVATTAVSRRILSPDEQAEYDAFNKNQQTRSNSSRFTAATIDDTVYAAIPGPPPRFQAPSTISTTSNNNKSSSSCNDDVAITKSIAFDQSAYTKNNKDDGGDDSHDGGGGGGSHIFANPSAPMSSEGLYKLPDLPAPITSQKDSSSSSSSSSLGLHLPEPPSMKENDLFDALQSRLAALQSSNDDPKTQE